MGKADIWPVIHAERQSLANDMGAIAPSQWSATSLCGDWTVRDVVAHMTATARMTPPGFFIKLAGSGFSFERVQAAGVASQRGASPEETLARFEAVHAATDHPPGPVDTMLGETIIHAEDIRRALGIKHEYPPGALLRIADFFKGSNMIIGAKRRIAGLSLRATDAYWRHGTGPEAAGPLLSLILAMTGRKTAADDLTGAGVAIIRERP